MELPSYRRKPVSIPSRPWMPACAGMTNQGKNHVVLRGFNFIVCTRAQAHVHFVVERTFSFKEQL
jgi:hypothetical protein